MLGVTKMNAKKLDRVKFYGLSWVIMLSFDTVEMANTFAENEGLNIKITEGNYRATARIED